MFSVHALIKTQ